MEWQPLARGMATVWRSDRGGKHRAFAERCSFFVSGAVRQSDDASDATHPRHPPRGPMGYPPRDEDGPTPMKVEVNGQEREVDEGVDLGSLVVLLGFHPEGVAVAVHGTRAPQAAIRCF